MSSSVKARTETTLRAGPSTEQAPTASFAIDSDSDASDSEVSEEEWWCDAIDDDALAAAALAAEMPEDKSDPQPRPPSALLDGSSASPLVGGQPASFFLQARPGAARSRAVTLLAVKTAGSEARPADVLEADSAKVAALPAIWQTARNRGARRRTEYEGMSEVLFGEEMLFGQLDDPAKLSPAELKKRHELEARERRNRSIWIEPGALNTVQESALKGANANPSRYHVAFCDQSCVSAMRGVHNTSYRRDVLDADGTPVLLPNGKPKREEVKVNEDIVETEGGKAVRLREVAYFADNGLRCEMAWLLTRTKDLPILVRRHHGEIVRAHNRIAERDEARRLAAANGDDSLLYCDGDYCGMPTRCKYPSGRMFVGSDMFHSHADMATGDRLYSSLLRQWADKHPGRTV